MARGLLSAGPMRRLAYVFVLAAACSGEVPGMGGPDASDEVDAAGDVDAPPAPALQVTGKSKDYFTAVTLATVSITTTGMQPEVTGASDSQGDFVLDNVPPGSVFYVDTRRELYRPTRNLAVKVTEASVVADQLGVSIADSRRQYVTLGLTPTAGRAVVFAELKRPNGMPLEGVPLADVVLADGLGAPVGLGPFFFGANGDLVSNATLATSTAFGGRARVGFLDVPPGEHVFKVTYTTGAGAPRTDETTIVTTADGATLTVNPAPAMGPGSGARTFTADVYPRLQTAANGGLGCANCHRMGGVAAVLPYDLPVMMTYDAIMARPGVVNLTAPADSMLLTKPLYEDPPNHPNATFLDVNDPDYLVIMQWIMQGATL